MVDYFSFEDVMHELEVSEEDLKRMVSEGELRAFRDENKMKFKRDDVEHLKKGRITEPTIILPSTPGGQDETVLDLDINQEAASLRAAEPPKARTPAPPPAPPPQSSEDDLLVTTPGDDSSLQNDETFIEEDSDTGLTTEPLRLADEAESADTVAEGEVTEEVTGATGRTRPARGARRGRAAAAAPLTEADEDAMELARPHAAWTGVLLAAVVLGLFSYAFVFDLLRMESGRTDQPSALTAGSAEWMVNKFWDDKAWKQTFVEKHYPGNGSIPPPFSAVSVGQPTPHRKYERATFRENDMPKVTSEQ